MLSDLHEPTAGATPGLDPPDRQDGFRRPPDRLRAGADGPPWSSTQPVPMWWHQLPELVSDRVRLRELRLSDALDLTEMVGSAPVCEHLSPGPASVVETEEFIAWTRRARRTGRYICFGVTRLDSDAVIGIFQIWPLEPGFHTAEWGFALGQRFWGTGLFEASARLVAAFAFERVGVLRLEARAAVDNVRANAALEKLGAVREGVLRKCFLTNLEYRDHVMWAILAEDWRHAQGHLTGRVTGVTGAVA